MLRLHAPARAVADDARSTACAPCGRRVEEFFADPRLRQLFARYATYNGCSPFTRRHAGGDRARRERLRHLRLSRAASIASPRRCARRAEELGVESMTCAPTWKRSSSSRRRPLEALARAACASAARSSAPMCVVANCDVADVYGRLLPAAPPARKLAAQIRSRGAVAVGLCAARASPSAAPLDLLHHNVFFSPRLRARVRGAGRPAPPARRSDRLRLRRARPARRALFLPHQRAAARRARARHRLDARSPALPGSASSGVLARHGWTLATDGDARNRPARLGRALPVVARARSTGWPRTRDGRVQASGQHQCRASAAYTSAAAASIPAPACRWFVCPRALPRSWRYSWR